MSNRNLSEDEFAGILKQQGLDVSSEQFAEHLSRVVMQKYKHRRPAAYKVRGWVGKYIIGLLVLFNLLFLYYLNPFSVQPVITISALAFVIGFWFLIPLMTQRKIQFPT